MDVTSLLNASSAANRRRTASIEDTPTPSATGGTTATNTAVPTPSPERTPPRRTSGSRSPTRNRTPWDAGGYSLPLTLDTKSIQSPSTAKPAFYTSESPTDQLNSASPKSPKHKFSDSRSSLSSYASSSNNSVSHSRISSLSTVSEFPPFSSVLSETLHSNSSSSGSLDVARITSAATGAANANIDQQQYQHRQHELGLRKFPLLGEVQPPSPTPIQQRHARTESIVSSGSDRGGSSPLDLPAHRPGSPSDAVLLRIRSHGSSSALNSPEESRDLSSLLPIEPSGSRNHKRAVSAPDFAVLNAGINGITATGFPTFGPMSEPTPPLSHQGDPAMNGPTNAPAAPVETAEEENMDEQVGEDNIERLLSAGPRCLFTSKCDTGSQLRKAISHIFGRNKSCTRKVPPAIWVHYCRKHYQRSRYRNANEYARLQLDLVQRQIIRIKAWSEINQRSGTGRYVQDWSLSPRKRERARLEGKSAKKRLHGQEHDEDDNGDPAVAVGTAIPKWLLEECDAGLSTEKILEVVACMKHQMDAGQMPLIPDIEILPNITGDGDDDDEARAKPAAKKKTAPGNAHKRSKSLGLGLRNEAANPMARRVSHPTARFWGDDGFGVSPAMKRPRLEVEDYFAEHPPTMGSMPIRNMDRVIPTVIRPASHRPAFGNIREHPAEDRFYDERQAYGYGAAPQGLSGPLPAPAPQRPGAQSMAQQLESNTVTYSYQDSRRPAAHQRSYSEMGAYSTQTSMGYRPSSSSGYASAPSIGMFGASIYSAGVPNGYESTSTAPNGYTDDYYVPATQSGGPPGYYDDYAAQSRQQSMQPHHQASFSTGNAPAYAQQHAQTTANYFQQSNATVAGPSGMSPSPMRHVRHSSTPLAHRPAANMMRAHSGSALAMTTQQQQPQQQQQQQQQLGGASPYAPQGSMRHARHQSYAAAPPSAMGRLVEEAEHARDLYGARR